jgi:hypothetical protein
MGTFTMDNISAMEAAFDFNEWLEQPIPTTPDIVSESNIASRHFNIAHLTTGTVPTSGKVILKTTSRND